MSKVRINVYSLRQVKEKSGLYEVDKTIRKPEDAVIAVNAVLELQEQAQEVFGILTLNTKNVIVGVHVISTGTIDASMSHPREVFKAALLNNAASIILFHNHPSGQTDPSRADVEITKRMMEAGELMGVTVLDHVVVGDSGQFTSLKQAGLID